MKLVAFMRDGRPRVREGEDRIRPCRLAEAEVAAGITLLPGDLIVTGTPAGVGIGFDPPRHLGPGDRVAAEVGGFARMENRIEERAIAQRKETAA